MANSGKNTNRSQFFITFKVWSRGSGREDVLFTYLPVCYCIVFGGRERMFVYLFTYLPVCYCIHVHSLPAIWTINIQSLVGLLVEWIL